MFQRSIPTDTPSVPSSTRGPRKSLSVVVRLLLSLAIVAVGTGCGGGTTVIIQQPALPPAPAPTTPGLPGSPSPSLARTTGGADPATGMVPVLMPAGAVVPPTAVVPAVPAVPAPAAETTVQANLRDFTVSPGPPQSVTVLVNGAPTPVDASVLANDIRTNPAKYNDLVAKGLVTRAQVDALAAVTTTPAPAAMAKTVGGADATSGAVQVQPAPPAATGTVPAPAAAAPVSANLKDFTFTPVVAGATPPAVPTASVLLAGVSTQVDVTTLQADAKANLAKYQALVTRGLMTQVQLDALVGGQRATVLAGADAQTGAVQVRKPDGTQVAAYLRDFTVAGSTVNVNLAGVPTPADVVALQADVRSQQAKYADLVKRGLMTQELLSALGGTTNFAFGPVLLKEYTLPKGT